jgi:hypothetical protein
MVFDNLKKHKGFPLATSGMLFWSISELKTPQLLRQKATKKSFKIDKILM